MKIVVSGVGQMGRYLAEVLLQEKHDLVLIEKDEEAADEARAHLDAQIIQGDGSDAMTLEPLIDESTDVFVAFTDDDDANIISSLIARKFGAKRVIARISNPSNLIHPLLTDDPSVSVLNPEMIVAKDLTRLVGTPSADEIEFFARNKAEVVRLHVGNPSAVAFKRLRDAQIPSSWLFIATIHNGNFEIVTGDTILRPNDQVLAVGDPAKHKEIEQLLGHHPAKVKKVILAGYNEIASKLIETLGRRHIDVRLIERNPKLADRAAAEHDHVLVLKGDVTSEDILDQAGVEEADYLVALTDDDETNILLSLLAKEKGAKRVITLTQKAQYKPIFEKIGIHSVISPRASMVDEVMRGIHHKEFAGINILEGGQGRMMEFVVKGQSRITDLPLSKIKLPKKTLIGAIVRDDELIIPRGDARIKAGDRVVVFSAQSVFSEVKKLFS